jgi:hypothetical protein
MANLAYDNRVLFLSRLELAGINGVEAATT